MTTYSSVFGDNTIPSADNSFAEVALSADTEFYWPELATGDNLVADTMEVTASAAYSMKFPEASSVSVGRAIVVRNAGAYSVTVTDNASGVLAVVLAGSSKLFQITDNSTTAGSWAVLTLGAGTSEADAYQLAGNGFTVDGTRLVVNYPVQNIVTDLTLNTTHRGKCLEFTAANKTLTLMIASVAGSGFGFTVKNSTGGSVTLDAAGSDTLDSYTTFNLSPLESVDIVSSGSKWVILTRGVSTIFQFTKLVKDISSATSFTLTSAEASNKLLQFIGTPTADTTVIVPSVVAVYYVQNTFTNVGYSLTLKTAAGTGVELEYFDRVVIYCDGVNVVLAQSTDAASAAASATEAYNSQVAAGVSEDNSALSAADALDYKTDAEASALNSQEWATKTTGQVEATDYSSKAYAIGGTGITSAIGAAKEWAITVGAAVISGAYSAKEWAVGTFTRGSAGGGSAKDWATYLAGTVDDSGYSAKYNANLSGTSASNAADSATNAHNSEVAAGLSASAAHDSEVAAAASAASIAGGPVYSVNGRTGAVTGVQDTLVSGTNIKTINGQALPGSGDLLIAGGLAPTAIKTADYTAVVNDLVRVDSTSAAFTVTLPSSPADGDKVGLFDTANQCGTHAVLIAAAGGKTVEGDATGLSVNINGSYVALLYNSATTNWKLQQTPMTGVYQPLSSALTTWAGKTAPSGDVLGTTDAQTLTNKTLTGYTETVYDLSGTSIDPANGTVQTKTLSANTTFTEAIGDGQSVLLGITASSYTVTWPSMTWSKVGGSGTAPTLTSSGVNWVVLWQVGGTLRGAFLGTA